MLAAEPFCQRLQPPTYFVQYRGAGLPFDRLLILHAQADVQGMPPWDFENAVRDIRIDRGGRPFFISRTYS